MDCDAVLRILKAYRKDLDAYGVKSVGVFGSVSRGEAQEGSDVDLLVDFSRPIGLFEFVRLKEYLEGLLARPVDLVTPRALRPQMRERIVNEAVYAG